MNKPELLSMKRELKTLMLERRFQPEHAEWMIIAEQTLIALKELIGLKEALKG